MKKVYISSFDLWAARHVRDVLRAAGHEVVSTWHEPGSARPESDDGWRTIIGDRNSREIHAADLLVLVACRNDVPGGKFVEAGIAIGAGKGVVVLGHRENRLLWHPLVLAVVPGTDELVEAVGFLI
jgi:nucleoside 2-deoxyribosyltransferase